MGRLAGKVAVITGGAGGIGRAAGQLFAEEGAAVLLVDRDETALREAADAMDSERVGYFVGDVTRAADNRAMMAAASERYGGLDVFVANAGIEGKLAPIVDLDESDFDEVMAVNVKGVFLGLQAAIPMLEARGGGSIIITSSIAGVTGTARLAPYATSKHAAIGLMRAAAKECAEHDIRVNTVNPSPVETAMIRRIEEAAAPGAPSEAKQMMVARIPMQRYAQPGDIAKVMLFLASDDSAWVTGSVYMADGGFSA